VRRIKSILTIPEYVQYSLTSSEHVKGF